MDLPSRTAHAACVFDDLLKGREEDWGAVPGAFGMELDGARIVGSWSQGRVRLVGRHTYRVQRVRKREGGPSDERTVYFTSLFAPCDPPLLLGLRITPRGAIERAAGDLFGGEPDIAIGHVALDRALEIRGREREHVASLLGDVASWQRLERLVGQPAFTVSDRGVDVELPGWERDVARVREALEAAASLAEHLLDRRRDMPPSWEPSLQRAWGEIAAAWRIGFDAPRLRMEGDVRGRGVCLETAAEGERLLTRVRIALPGAAGVHLGLARQDGDGFFKRLFRGQDIATGDVAFDAAFVVRGDPEDGVRARLGPAARAQLLQLLAGDAGIEVKDGALLVSAGAPMLSAEALDALLKLAFSAAEALG